LYKKISPTQECGLSPTQELRFSPYQENENVIKRYYSIKEENIRVSDLKRKSGLLFVY